MFLIQLPHVRHIRDRCPYRFRDLHCKYPEDHFEKGTEQDLRWGGDANKGGGWNTLNIANTAIADTNRTNAGKLTVQTAAGGPFAFWGTTRTAPQIYKEFKGNFDFYTWFDGPITNQSHFGFYIQASDDLGDSRAIMMSEEGGRKLMFLQVTENELSYQNQLGEMMKGLRVVRVGATLQFSGRISEDDDWTVLTYTTIGTYPDALRIGYVFPTTTSLPGIAMTVDYFAANSGGDATCSYSLDGINGCRDKMNQPRFGGAAGLPYGRLYL
jgi:hypothetical protein